MTITYFKDTDTLLVTFNANKVEETRDLSEHVIVDLDADNNIVSMTVEHATQTANIANFAFNQVEAKAA